MSIWKKTTKLFCVTNFQNKYSFCFLIYYKFSSEIFTVSKEVIWLMISYAPYDYIIMYSLTLCKDRIMIAHFHLHRITLHNRSTSINSHSLTNAIIRYTPLTTWTSCLKQCLARDCRKHILPHTHYNFLVKTMQKKKSCVFIKEKMTVHIKVTIIFKS